MENRLLACLAAPDSALLAPHLKQAPLFRGAVLHEPNTPIEWVYFPMSSAVSLLAVMKGGQAVETASVGCEGAVGLSAHSRSWQASFKSIVQVQGIAKYIPASALRVAMVESEHIRDLMIRYMETLSAQSQQIAACNALHSVEQRLARWLLQISDRIDSAQIPVTQGAISQMLGVRRTTVTLVVRQFQQDNLIRCRRARITIVNPSALHALACECYGACKQAEQLVHRPNIEVKASA